SLPIPLSKSRLQPHERITFYDQKHATGSDIKQAPIGIALASINQHTTLRDLLQAVWRMRGLDKSQSVEFVVDAEVEKMIFLVLEQLTGKKITTLTLADVLLFVTYNQAKLQGDNNYRSLKHKMKAILQAEAFKALLDPTVQAGPLKQLIKDVEAL